jgi:hypothetical protein
MWKKWSNKKRNKEWNQNEGQRDGGKGAAVYVCRNDFY